ncbi:transposase [Nonomuraea spiralis]|uniref:Transposase n=1 Tax=Nonomuraea spiralis TaxID=46182 RepID=A0ABV5IL65_9ACTN
MARRGELTDKAWERIAPLLPVAAGPGRPWRGHRQVVNGILWRFETGATWREIPERYGPWQTCYERFKRWTEDGTWARVLEEAQAEDEHDPAPSPLPPHPRPSRIRKDRGLPTRTPENPPEGAEEDSQSAATEPPALTNPTSINIRIHAHKEASD